MPFLSTISSRFALGIASLVLASAVLSCSREPVAGPRDAHSEGLAAFGKAPAALAVNSATPAYGNPGQTVDVHVYGSGFTVGAQATWLLHGVADPGHVKTNKTTFV